MVEMFSETMRRMKIRTKALVVFLRRKMVMIVFVNGQSPQGELCLIILCIIGVDKMRRSESNQMSRERSRT